MTEAEFLALEPGDVVYRCKPGEAKPRALLVVRHEHKTSSEILFIDAHDWTFDGYGMSRIVWRAKNSLAADVHLTPEKAVGARLEAICRESEALLDRFGESEIRLAVERFDDPKPTIGDRFRRRLREVLG